MRMFGRRYHLWEAGSNKTTKEHVKKLSSRIDRLETIVSELTHECGYVVAIEDFDTEYCSLKKVSKK